MAPFYARDGITLYVGDCREILPTLRADVIITDPPFNAGKNYGKTTNDRMEWPEWCRWWDDCLALQLESAPDVLAFLSQTAYRKYCRLGAHEPDWALAWVKPLALSVCAMPFMPHHEPIGYWGKTRKKDKAFWGGDVLTHNVTRNEWGHPTEKPIRLMRELVGKFEGVVLDPFAGSGTTLRAAKDLGREAIGIEVNPAFAEIIVRRLQQAVLPPRALETTQPGIDLAAATAGH